MFFVVVVVDVFVFFSQQAFIHTELLSHPVLFIQQNNASSNTVLLTCVITERLLSLTFLCRTCLHSC